MPIRNVRNMIEYILRHLQHDMCLWILVLGIGFGLGAACAGAILWNITKDKYGTTENDTHRPA